MKKKVAVFAAVAASTAAIAATSANAVVTASPLSLSVICVDVVTDNPGVVNDTYRVHFGYSSTAAIPASDVRSSEIDRNRDDWPVVSSTKPEDFQTTGFSDTGGAVVEAFVVENNPGKGDRRVRWDVELKGDDPPEVSFDAEKDPAPVCAAGGAGAAGGAAAAPPEPVRAIYCAAAGNTVNGQPVVPGTALDLRLGQPNSDPNYTGATPAIFVQGIGATCDPPPAGFSFDGATFVDGVGQAHGFANAIYPFFKA